MAKALKLTPVGKIQVQGATGVSAFNSYIVDFIFPFGNQALHAPGVTVTEFASGPNLDVLIGRDIICQGSLTMIFPNQFCFCL